jgi:hypothetical protein
MILNIVSSKERTRYVLERHLKRDEVIHPLVELGKFRGEPVYSRSSVVTLKTAENWMRQGRKVREGCQPMKWVKQHAATVNKKRAIEMAMADRSDGLSVAGGNQNAGFSNERDVMQAMYAENQTELYIADPVIDVSYIICSTHVWLLTLVCRARYQRTILVTSIFMFPRCCHLGVHMYLVRLALLMFC